MAMPDVKFLKLVLLVNCVVPVTLLGWDAWHHRLGANPQEFLLHTTGTLTLVFLALSLSVTPLRKALGLPWMIQFRRLLGLCAFFHSVLHLLAYTWFDKSFDFAAIVQDSVKRPFIFLGMLGFLLMVPLAATSTNGMVKRLGGQRWNRLHKAAYVAAVAGVLHYYLLVKADITKPLGFGIAIAVLFAFRILNRYFPAWTQRSPARARS